MNTYQAIMLAADHIERHPDDFNFTCLYIPSCGTPGCALGWIAHFKGMEHSLYTVHDLARQIVGELPDIFYNKIFDLSRTIDQKIAWTRSAALCAASLRLYAEQYHKPAAMDPVLANMLKGMDEILTTEDLTS